MRQKKRGVFLKYKTKIYLNTKQGASQTRHLNFPIQLFQASYERHEPYIPNQHEKNVYIYPLPNSLLFEESHPDLNFWIETLILFVDECFFLKDHPSHLLNN